MNIIQTTEGFSTILSDDETNKMLFPSSFSDEVFVRISDSQKKMPFLIQLYFGGLSIIGLYLLYNSIRPRK
jgi:hypothetical protein